MTQQTQDLTHLVCPVCGFREPDPAEWLWPELTEEKPKVRTRCQGCGALLEAWAAEALLWCARTLHADKEGIGAVLEAVDLLLADCRFDERGRLIEAAPKGLHPALEFLRQRRLALINPRADQGDADGRRRHP